MIHHLIPLLRPLPLCRYVKTPPLFVYGSSQRTITGADLNGIEGGWSLNQILCDFHGTQPYQEIKQIIRRYREMSNMNLVTLRDLLRLMLTLKSYHTPKAKIVESDRDLPSHILKRSNKHVTKDRPNRGTGVLRQRQLKWAADGLRGEQAAEVIVDAIIQNKEENYGQGGMTRQDVRDAARMHIDDTGLLDSMLKMMNNVVVRNFVMRRAVNPSTRVLEYSVNNLGDDGTSKKVEQLVPQSCPPLQSAATGDDVYRDMFSIYEANLLRYPKGDWVGLACSASIV